MLSGNVTKRLAKLGKPITQVHQFAVLIAVAESTGLFDNDTMDEIASWLGDDWTPNIVQEIIVDAENMTADLVADLTGG